MKSQMCPHVQYQLLCFDDNQLPCNQIQNPHHGRGHQCLVLSAWLDTYREVNLLAANCLPNPHAFPIEKSGSQPYSETPLLLKNSGVNAEIPGDQDAEISGGCVSIPKQVT